MAVQQTGPWGSVPDVELDEDDDFDEDEVDTPKTLRRVLTRLVISYTLIAILWAWLACASVETFGWGRGMLLWMIEVIVISVVFRVARFFCRLAWRL